MQPRFATFAALMTLFVAAVTPGSGISEESSKSSKKVRALMVTGGCCHDYQNQKRLISEGLSARVGPIEWTILQYDDAKDTKADVYRQTDWIREFDIVVHNECFGGVEDGEFVTGVVDAHVEHGVPAIMVHCSMHSYRAAPTADAWRELIGVTSRRHERAKRSLTVKPTDAGADHAIMKTMKGQWQTPNGELYIIEKVWPSATVLATAYSHETEKDEPVIWINQWRGVRSFGISLGHHNETIEAETWQSVVADGWRWALAD